MIGRGSGDALRSTNDSRMGTRRASPAAASNPALRHHRPRHRGDDTSPDDHARPARTEHATRGAAGHDTRAPSDRRVQPAVTSADYESPGTTRPRPGSLARHNDSNPSAPIPVASKFGPSLQTLAPDETRPSERSLTRSRSRARSGSGARQARTASNA